jgi:hypothetical protein
MAGAGPGRPCQVNLPSWLVFLLGVLVILAILSLVGLGVHVGG